MATKNVINPAEMSVEEKLKALYELQQTLTAIDEKRALRGELPLEVQDLEDEVEGLKTRMEKINDEVKEINDAIAQKNIEVAKATDNVERYKKQLNDVKNNREYDTLSKEIEFQSLEIELAQKKIREGNKKLELKATIPIFAMTANAFEEDRKAAFECGMNEHIAKPVDVQKLIQMLSEVLK